MKISAYCTYPVKSIVEEVAGVPPFTSPPLTIQTFHQSGEPYDALFLSNIIYFRLHGLPLIPNRWFGEDMDGNLIAAIGREHIQSIKLLPNTVVILANCYGAESPMVQDFYNVGAAVVIAGSGPNYAGVNVITGVDLLAKEIITALQDNHSAEGALLLAKRKLLFKSWQQPNRDTLGFHIMEKIP